MHNVNMQTPHRKANPGPTNCEATVLTTTPPCHLYLQCIYFKLLTESVHLIYLMKFSFYLTVAIDAIGQ